MSDKNEKKPKTVKILQRKSKQPRVKKNNKKFWDFLKKVLIIQINIFIICLYGFT